MLGSYLNKANSTFFKTVSNSPFNNPPTARDNIVSLNTASWNNQPKKVSQHEYGYVWLIALQ
jgi:hypothetical protein